MDVSWSFVSTTVWQSFIDRVKVFHADEMYPRIGDKAGGGCVVRAGFESACQAEANRVQRTTIA